MINTLTPIDAFLYESFTASDGTVLPYRYYLPKDYKTSGKKYPLFLYMHGNGSRGTDNLAQLRTYSINNAVFNSNYECIMLAPQCPGSPSEWTAYKSTGINTYPGSKAYASFFESGRPYVSRHFCASAELLNTFLTSYRVDTSRIYLAGGSNGAGAVWNFAALYPEVFAAAVPVAGCRAEENYVFSVAHRYKSMPIWAIHGDNDNVVPTEGTRIMYKAIKSLGGNIKYTEVEGGNHSNIWKIAADTEGLIEWMFSQIKHDFENTISKGKRKELPAPENLVWDNNSATWDEVEDAGAYKVTFYKDGIKIKSFYCNKNAYTPDPSLNDIGANSFSVRALPQNNKYSISLESQMSDVL